MAAQQEGGPANAPNQLQSAFGRLEGERIEAAVSTDTLGKSRVQSPAGVPGSPLLLQQ